MTQEQKSQALKTI